MKIEACEWWIFMHICREPKPRANTLGRVWTPTLSSSTSDVQFRYSFWQQMIRQYGWKETLTRFNTEMLIWVDFRLFVNLDGSGNLLWQSWETRLKVEFADITRGCKYPPRVHRRRLTAKKCTKCKNSKTNNNLELFIFYGTLSSEYERVYLKTFNTEGVVGTVIIIVNLKLPSIEILVKPYVRENI